MRWIESVGSTNSWVREHEAEVASLEMICAREQTAGRGQRGNSWEAEPGKNLTFSFLLREPPVAPAAQFAVSEAVALAMTSFLADYGIAARVKWPNDIYAGDRKICGILIENSIMGSVLTRCIAGVGLNVNQRQFLSDAPNPVSMALLTGREYDLDVVGECLETRLREYVERLEEPEELHKEYQGRLWRLDGRRHRFREAATGEEFEAVVEGVEPSGHLRLLTEEGERLFAFKEVAWL